MIKNLKSLRQKKGVSQQQLADVVMVSQQSINKYENHNIEPDIETLIKLADYFDVSIDYLVGRSSQEAAKDADSSQLSNKETSLIREYRKLNNTQQQCIKSLINSYK